jgi:hypothetical protein
MQLVAVPAFFISVGIGLGTVSACGGKLGDELSCALRALGFYGREDSGCWSGAFRWVTFSFGLRYGNCCTVFSATDADFGLTGVSSTTMTGLSRLMAPLICPASAACTMAACTLSAMPSLVSCVNKRLNVDLLDSLCHAKKPKMRRNVFSILNRSRIAAVHYMPARP